MLRREISQEQKEVWGSTSSVSTQRARRSPEALPSCGRDACTVTVDTAATDESPEHHDLPGGLGRSFPPVLISQSHGRVYK